MVQESGTIVIGPFDYPDNQKAALWHRNSGAAPDDLGSAANYSRWIGLSTAAIHRHSYYLHELVIVVDRAGKLPTAERTTIAQHNMRTSSISGARPDAVKSCFSALKKTRMAIRYFRKIRTNKKKHMNKYPLLFPGFPMNFILSIIISRILSSVKPLIYNNCRFFPLIIYKN